MSKVWSKRFDNTLNPFIEKFNASIGFDRKLILEDLACSIAHAKMLGKTNVLSSSETLQIINGLEKIKVEYLEGKFFPGSPSEDIHYCIEEKLISLIGYKNTIKYANDLTLKINNKVKKYGSKSQNLSKTLNYILNRNK